MSQWLVLCEIPLLCNAALLHKLDISRPVHLIDHCLKAVRPRKKALKNFKESHEEDIM